VKFQYTIIPTLDPTRQWLGRPMLPIVVHGPTQSTAVAALVDSGADHSVFHADIARDIGLVLESGTREVFSGVEGGALPAWLHRLSIEVVGIEGVCPLVAGFVDSPGVSAILGQDGFFDAHRIKFEKDHNTFEISPVRKK
jgi:hypothetical protein